MNYIRHLNNFFQLVKRDERLTPMHLSLYMALFQTWNSNRFRQAFPIYREQILRQCKIGSKATYMKCLKELHAAGYIQVQPAMSKFMPPKVLMRNFESHTLQSKQKNLFEESETEPGNRSGEDYNDEGSEQSLHLKKGPVPVPDPTPAGTENEPVTVPDLTPLYKQVNIIKESKGTPTLSTKKNQKENKGSFPPETDLVEAFFRELGQPPTEARKFYLYYQSIGWRVQGGTAPITDWKAMAEKWVLNDKSQNSNATKPKPGNTLHITNDKNFSQPL